MYKIIDGKVYKEQNVTSKSNVKRLIGNELQFKVSGGESITLNTTVEIVVYKMGFNTTKGEWVIDTSFEDPVRVEIKGVTESLAFTLGKAVFDFVSEEVGTFEVTIEEEKFYLEVIADE